MQMITALDDGTTTVEFTPAEGRALRSVLLLLAGSPTADRLQRLMATVHGEAADSRVVHPRTAPQED